MIKFTELSYSKAGDAIADLNDTCKDLGLGHLFYHGDDASKALVKVQAIGEHLETVLNFCRDKRLGASIVDIEEAIELCKVTLAELCTYREYEDSWHAPEDVWFKGDDR